MYHSPSVSVRGWACPSKLDSPAFPHDSQLEAIKGSSPNQGSDGGSTQVTQHNQSFQSPSEGGASPAGSGEKPERPSFKCTDCSTRCTQKQVLMRHYREKHQPGFECLENDCDHKWTQSRKSEYRKHLREEHRLEDDKIDKILGPPRRRGKSRVIESDPPLPIERDRRSLAEPQQPPLMLPLPAVGEDAHHASLPLIPSVAYNPPLGRVEPEVTTTDHEDSSGLEHLAVTHAPSRLVSEEDFALLKGNYKSHGRFRFPSTRPGGSTTVDIPPSSGMLHIPALPPASGKRSFASSR